MGEKILRYKKKIRKYGDSLYLLLPFEWTRDKKLKHDDELIVEESKDKLIITKEVKLNKSGLKKQ